MRSKMKACGEISGTGNGGRTYRRCVMIAAVLLLCAAGAFAAESIAVLDSAGDKIISIIGSKWVKALLAVALVIEFGVIAFGNAQGQGDIIKKVLPWVIGTAGILGATSIVNFFFSNVKSETISMAASMLPLIV